MNRRKDLPLQQPLNIGGKHIHANKRASPFRSFLPVDTTYGEELRELACHLAAFPYLSLYGKHTQENRKRTLHSPSSYSPSILYENWRQEILHLRQKLFCWILISLLQGFQKGWHPLSTNLSWTSFSRRRQVRNKMLRETQFASSVSVHRIQVSISGRSALGNSYFI